METNRVYNLDCREGIKLIPSESIDLIIADPFFNEWDKFYDLPLDCLKKDGVYVAFSNRPHTGRLQVELDKRLHFRTEVVWNFADGRWVSNRLPRICHENILIYSKSKRNPLNDMRLLDWIEKPKPVKKGGASIGKWRSKERFYIPQEYAQVESVIYHPRHVGKKMGIVSKPAPLIDLILKMSTQEGGTVLDLFAGSGIVFKCCHRLKRDYIGFEIDRDVYESL